MKYFIDVSFDSLNKYGEELCGDKVEVVSTDNGVIIALADGLGSGVKANILSTLTSKILTTMIKNGASIDETVDTIVHTLPVCNERKLAYSTFTIVNINNDGRVYIVEYDNPNYFVISKNKKINITKNVAIISDKIVLESKFTLEDGDSLILVSDGVIHAGIGGLLKLGWKWENVRKYLKNIVPKEKSSKNIVENLLEISKRLYLSKPGDDTTAVVVTINKIKSIDLFTGPPKDRKKDELIVRNLMKGKGKKIVCGGTAARIVERVLGEKLEIDLSTLTSDIPPLGKMKDIDIVTEGVLTLSKVVDKIERYIKYGERQYLIGEDAASVLCCALIEECNNINFWVGKAINPAHQNPSLPIDLSVKLKLVGKLSNLLKKLGKKVKVNFVE